MKIDLSGTTAIVTGSTGGIGLAIVRGLAGSGASVFGVFADAAEHDAAAAPLGALGFATWRAETLSAWPEPRSSAG